ncbi:unnamed protein product [Clonostachys rosea f. rosea IK726]|uniref:Uncharacterized protein n=1 Tax=Clonostachys rosea f. rosea IK726 TaxID=1349383 RepID=A0ACA9UPJ9_BIOOC|nr:unnamed protein product [Clonostachys rosea f. rosea IK726]
MDMDSDNELLSQLAAGDTIPSCAWARPYSPCNLKIAHQDFPIPKLPPPPKIPSPITDSEGRIVSPPLPSQDADKENDPGQPRAPAVQELEPGQLPKQIIDMLQVISNHLKKFETSPPHTIQRIAELILRPRAHYKALAPYLHAVDRVVLVTSNTDVYPLPPVAPDINGQSSDGDASDPAAQVAWSNSTSAALGTDEALGGALLTPIPWLTKGGSDGVGGGVDTPGAQIHCESTETIDGPNGVGSIETVSVSFNGIPSIGRARGVTQGELLRQEQRAGVVPVSQLPRQQQGQQPGSNVERSSTDESGEQPPEQQDQEDEELEDELEEQPHARGPEEIGVDDLGPQSSSSAYVGGAGLETRDIDVEAAVGRKHEDQDSVSSASAPRSPGAESTSSKREAESGLEGEPAKKHAKNEAKDDDIELPNAEADGSAAGENGASHADSMETDS